MSTHEGSRREMEYRVIRAQEDERKRLARDLHDGLVQSLVGIGISLEATERCVDADPVRKPEALLLLAEVREALAGCLEETRRILSDLRPLDLTGRSLAQALKDYAEKTSAEAGLKVTVVISGQDLRLHPALEAGLFRIFQEALNNVREHAEAREVSLKLRFLARSVAMDVSDDGKGFTWNGDLRELGRRRCFGLLGIDERVRLLGGTWRISTRPGEGTEIRVRLPVESQSGFWSFLPQLGRGDRAGPSPAGAGPAGAGPGDGPLAEAGTPALPAGVEESGTAPPGRRRERGWPNAGRPDSPVRVVLADDHRVIREGLRMMLDLARGVEVVGEAATGDEAVTQCRDLAPDVVLLDLVMPVPERPKPRGASAGRARRRRWWP